MKVTYMGKVREKVIEKSAILLGYFQFGRHKIGLSKTPDPFYKVDRFQAPYYCLEKRADCKSNILGSVFVIAHW